MSVRLLKQIGDFPLHIDAIALVPNGSALAVAAAGSGIDLWRMDSYTHESQLEIPEEAFQQFDPFLLFKYGSDSPIMVRDLAFSHDGTFVATAFTNREVTICIREGALLETLPRPAVSLVFVASKDLLILCLENGDIELWEVVPARLVASWAGVANAAELSFSLQILSKCGCTCSSDGTQIAVVSTFLDSKRLKTASYVHIWDLIGQSGQVIPSLRRMVKAPTQISTIMRGLYLRDRHCMFCYDSSGSFWEVDTNTGATLALLESKPYGAPRISSGSPDGRWVAIANREGEVAIWDVQEQREILVFQAHHLVKEEIDATEAMVWLPDGKRLITVGTSRAENDRGQQSMEKFPASHRPTTIKVWNISVS